MKLDLNRDELLLIDWVLHYPAPAQSLDYDDHMKWHGLRAEVWHGVLEIEKSQNDSTRYIVEVNDLDARQLLALLPTTFMWGDRGSDCGFSLKCKIAASMRR